MTDLSAALDELVADAPVAALAWSEVVGRSDGRRERSQRRRRRRRPTVAALAAAAALTIAGTAVGVSVFNLPLLDQQERLHAGMPDDPERIGPLVEVTSDDAWALIAWRSNFGICLDFAIRGNSPWACDFPVRGAKAPTDSSGSGLPIHAVAGQVSGGGLVGGDGKTTIFGVAAADVASVKVELRKRRLVNAPLYDSPPGLDAGVRFFVVRMMLPSIPPAHVANGQMLAIADGPVLAYLAFDRNGVLMERVPVKG